MDPAGLRDTGRVELSGWLRVDGDADRPLFDQLRTQIIEAIRAGTLAPGARLPTVRELAGEVGLARGLGLGKAEALRYLKSYPDD